MEYSVTYSIHIETKGTVLVSAYKGVWVSKQFPEYVSVFCLKQDGGICSENSPFLAAHVFKLMWQRFPDIAEIKLGIIKQSFYAGNVARQHRYVQLPSEESFRVRPCRFILEHIAYPLQNNINIPPYRATSVLPISTAAKPYLDLAIFYLYSTPLEHRALLDVTIRN